MLGVYYNKDVFKAAGLTESNFPKSYDELLALGRTVKDRTDAAGFYEAGGDKWPLQWQMQVQLTDLDAQWWADLNQNKEKLTDPVVVGAIKKYKEKLLDAGLAQKNYKTGTFTGQARRPVEGRGRHGPQRQLLLEPVAGHLHGRDRQEDRLVPDRQLLGHRHFIRPTRPTASSRSGRVTRSGRTRPGSSSPSGSAPTTPTTSRR